MLHLTVLSVPISLSTPFTEGHRLTAAEAKALNTLRGERIRTNLLKWAARRPEGVSQEEILSRALTYDHEFTFSSKESPEVTEESIAQQLADEQALEWFRQQGIEATPSELEAKSQELQAFGPLRAEASRRFAIRKQELARAVESLL